MMEILHAPLNRFPAKYLLTIMSKPYNQGKREGTKMIFFYKKNMQLKKDEIKCYKRKYLPNSYLPVNNVCQVLFDKIE